MQTSLASSSISESLARLKYDRTPTWSPHSLRRRQRSCSVWNPSLHRRPRQPPHLQMRAGPAVGLLDRKVFPTQHCGGFVVLLGRSRSSHISLVPLSTTASRFVTLCQV